MLGNLLNNQKNINSQNLLFLPDVLRYRNENQPNPEEKAGIIKHSGPANSKYSTLESRLKSFKDWPPALRQKPKQLAEAGFYHDPDGKDADRVS